MDNNVLDLSHLHLTPSDAQEIGSFLNSLEFPISRISCSDSTFGEEREMALTFLFDSFKQSTGIKEIIISFPNSATPDIDQFSGLLACFAPVKELRMDLGIIFFIFFLGIYCVFRRT